MRLNKRISHAGFCSRRQADKIISEGRVAVDQQIVTNLATEVTDLQQITIDGQALKSVQCARLWLYYKPRGYITSHRAQDKRPIIFDHLPKDLPRVIAVGRLDINSEGLLLLTNNGEVARYFELPKNKIKRVYQVRAFGDADHSKLALLSQGVTIDQVKYDPAKVKLLRGEGKNRWYEVVIYEGKNREVRKMFEYCNLQVNKLIRIAYGSYQLKTMRPGDVVEITDFEWK